MVIHFPVETTKRPATALDCVTTMFIPTEIVFQDQSGFVVAKGHWRESLGTISIACRYHEDNKNGSPVRYGKPYWILLPPQFCDWSGLQTTLNQQQLDNMSISSEN